MTYDPRAPDDGRENAQPQTMKVNIPPPPFQELCRRLRQRKVGAIDPDSHTVVQSVDPLTCEAADSIGALVNALEGLILAVQYTAPPKNYGTAETPNICYDARVPDFFVHQALQALAGKP